MLGENFRLSFPVDLRSIFTFLVFLLSSKLSLFEGERADLLGWLILPGAH
jgi:hypothetical protein